MKLSSIAAIALAGALTAGCGSAPPQQHVPIVQPGAPGTASQTVSAAKASDESRVEYTAADVQFMQGMILHHAQAVEMTAMIPSHTQNKELRSLGARISSSQTDEIKFMKRWLAA
ncbi:MAG TPA: DUF305 domain-containing protein, partial [Vicinamibacterales bacterium]